MIAIERVVLIIIFLIVLVICVYVLFGFVKPSGEQINIQNQIRECCTIYRASGCPDLSNVVISCGSSSLKDLIGKVSMTVDQLKNFCGGCPP